jgi:cobalt/nickel transport system permease protein
VAAGFVLAALLALWAAWGVRDEEIPRIALLTVAFFLASSIHLRLGPTSAHLLLTGLVGVVLGRRAPLAVLVGVTLQAALIPHGGYTTIGVNACVEAIPALLCGYLFAALRGSGWLRRGWFRAGLVGSSATLLAAGLVGGLALLSSPAAEPLFRASDTGGLVGGIPAPDFQPVFAALSHPLALAFIALCTLVAALAAPRLDASAEFPLGLLIGVLSVLGTVSLTGFLLLADRRDTWQTFVTVLFLAHLPLATFEGVMLGTVVRFLARVKPELLRAEVRAEWQEDEEKEPLALSAR